MGRRSIKATEQGIQKLEQTLKRKKKSQTYLSGAVGCSRQTIWSLLSGNPIDCDVFMDVCKELDLDWQEVAEPEFAGPESIDQNSVSTLVQTMREQVRSLIQERCGTMRVLDMTRPIDLDGERGIYTNVNILERIISRRRLGIDELLKQCDAAEFERFGLGKIQEKRIAGTIAIERFSKLMVLGKPGAGKTTFLKYLAIQCIHGKILSDHVPVFVTLKNFAEDERLFDLQTYLQAYLQPYIGDKSFLPVLQAGNALLLLDGLDEVREEDTKRVISQIQQLAQWFPINRLVITCRIAAKEYPFETFTEVEVADFDDEQIRTFAEKWFQPKDDNDKSKAFLKALETNKRIKDLATSPLILTLFCLMFEETSDFPVNRSELYQEIIDELLLKWDEKRVVERERVYKILSPEYKEDLLCKFALTAFENEEYFFKKRVLEGYIANFIRELPDIKNELEAMHLGSEAILKSIKSHHGLLIERAKGVYSFSHLTFQEYFVAREIVKSQDRLLLEKLVKHVTEPRWREVFLLTSGMLLNADKLMRLMKREVDHLLADYPRLQEFLSWVQEKSMTVQVKNRPRSIRSLYFSLSLLRDRNIIHDLISVYEDDEIRIDILLLGVIHNSMESFEYFTSVQDYDSKSDLDLLHVINDPTLGIDRVLRIRSMNPDLRQKLQNLREQMPSSYKKIEDRKEARKWWNATGPSWISHLKNVALQYRNLRCDWNFNDEQREILQQYHNANKLLVDCLNGGCHISLTVREEIENTLLLPISST